MDKVAGMCPEAVVHAATNYGRDGSRLSQLVSDNIVYPVQILEAATKGGALRLFVNTDSFFSRPTAPGGYMAHYSFTKRALSQALALPHSVPVASLRLEHVYGPGDSGGKFVPWLLQSLCSSDGVIPLGDGEQLRDFVYVDDVVAAFCSVLDHAGDIGPRYREFEVGSGGAISVRHFVERAHVLSRSRATLKFGARTNRFGELAASAANTAPLRELGWSPRFDVDEGLAACLRDLDRRGHTLQNRPAP